MQETLHVYFDGSCGPAPGGTAAYGFVVKNADGDIVHSQHGRVGSGPSMTGNVGEYEALYQAMRYIATHHPKYHVIFHGDSTLVISQMRGESKARKGKYLPYFYKSAALAEPFVEARLWTFQWIQRALNSEADDLAQYRF